MSQPSSPPISHNEPAPPPQPPDAVPESATAEKRQRKRQARKRARAAASQRNRQNTSIYISDLPPDVTHEQIEKFCAKCGILLPDARTGRARIKIYTDEHGRVKGDALVTYALRPSVLNAVDILDGALLRAEGPAVRVAEASFDHKQARTPHSVDVSEARADAPRLSVRDYVQEKMSWDDNDNNGDSTKLRSASRIVVLKNVFDAHKADYQLIREDMHEGCVQIGAVEKITVFEGNEDGAVAVKFRSIESCLRCIQVMNGRWYDGRQLSAQFYDGRTDYRHKESDAEREERERKWKEWLESDSCNKPNSQFN